MDALALPTLGVLIAIFLVYIWVAWVSPKAGRALTVKDDDDEDDPLASSE